MKHDYTSVQNIYIICGKTDMRNYENYSLMEIELVKARKNRKVYRLTLPIIFHTELIY